MARASGVSRFTKELAEFLADLAAGGAGRALRLLWTGKEVVEGALLGPPTPELAKFGLASAGGDFQEGAERFLREYLGGENRVVPFGGRAAELAELRRWVGDPEAPVRGLLTAPAGRGKSALVARFAADMAHREDVDLLFLPVSIRFETNAEHAFWQAFAAGLADIAKLDRPAEASVGAARAFVRKELDRLAGKSRERRLLVVVDGLDEAAGWRLPEDLVPGFSRRLRFLVAARELAATDPAEDWLARLGWQKDDVRLFGLPPLDEEAIRWLLAETGAYVRSVADAWPARWRVDDAAGMLDAFLRHHLAERPEDRRARELREEVRRLRREATGEGSRDLDALATRLAALVERVRQAAEQLARLAEEGEVASELFRLSEGEPLLLRFHVEMLLDHFLAGDATPAVEVLAGLEPGYHGVFARWLEDERKRTRQRGEEWDGERIGYLLALLALAEGPLRFDQLAALHRTASRSDRPLPREAFEPLRRFVIGDAESGYVLQHPKIAAYLREKYFADPKFLADAGRAFADWFEGVVDALSHGQRAAGAVPAYLLRHGVAHIADRPELWPRLAEAPWRDAHLAAGHGEAGFVRDVERVYALARGRPLPETLGLRLRCALVLASYRALGRIIPDDLLIAAAEEGLISPEEAELIALQRSEPEDRATTFLRLGQVRRFPERDRRRFLEEALRLALGIEDERARAQVLASLAPHLPEGERAEVLREALEAARRIRAKEKRAEVLAALAPYLPEAVLEAAGGFESERERAQVLAALAPHLPEAVLEEARKIELEWARALVLAALAPYLPKAVLEAARKIGDEWKRAQVLAALAPHLPEEERAEVVEEILRAAHGIAEQWQRAEVLAALAPHLPEAVLEEARKIELEWARALVLAALAPHLPEEERAEVVEEILRAAHGIAEQWRRAEVLAALAPHLPEAVLEAARQIGDESTRAQVRVALAPHLPEAVLEAARKIGDEWKRAQVLAALAPHLAGPVREQDLAEPVLEAAGGIGDEGWRALVLAALAPHLEGVQREEALAELIDLGARALPRPEFLGHLTEVLPAIRAVGGEAAVQELVRAVEDVGAWYP